MTEWWTYGLSDFLMFSPQAYWRLVARYNAAWWPAQMVALAAGCGLLVLVLVRRPDVAAARAALVLLAAAWAWVGWAFHARQYAEIFLAAPWLAWTCGVQASMLLVAAATSRDAHPAPAASKAGTLLLVLALLFPLLAPLSGRDLQQAEVFGFMPDPTALATLGVLLALAQPRASTRAALAVIPALVLLLGAATRWLLA